jgi:hypothetical protein
MSSAPVSCLVLVPLVMSSAPVSCLVPLVPSPAPVSCQAPPRSFAPWGDAPPLLAIDQVRRIPRPLWADDTLRAVPYPSLTARATASCFRRTTLARSQSQRPQGVQLPRRIQPTFPPSQKNETNPTTHWGPCENPLGCVDSSNRVARVRRSGIQSRQGCTLARPETHPKTPAPKKPSRT